MSGALRMTIFSARRWASIRASADLANLLFSKVSRTKALTTRMPVRFSCTAPFMLSYLVISTRKRG